MCRQLTELALLFCQKIGNNALLEVGRGCKFLQALHLVGCSSIGDEGICGIARGCQNLKKLHIRRCYEVLSLSLAHANTHLVLVLHLLPKNFLLVCQIFTIMQIVPCIHFAFKYCTFVHDALDSCSHRKWLYLNASWRGMNYEFSQSILCVGQCWITKTSVTDVIFTI